LNGHGQSLVASLVIVAVQFSVTAAALGVNVAVATPPDAVPAAGVMVPQPETLKVTVPVKAAPDDVTVALIVEDVGEDTDVGVAISQRA